MEVRAQSSTIGYVLIFSIIFTTMGAVYLGAFPALQDNRDFQQFQNARRAFDVLSSNIEDVTRDGAPSRSTEIKLYESGIERGETVEFEISGTHDSNSNLDFTITKSFKPIVYDAESGNIVYSNGALLIDQREGNSMFNEPGFTLDDDGLIVSLVVMNHDSEASLFGDRVMVVKARNGGQEVELIEDTGHYDTITFTIETDRAGAWRSYLSDSADVDCSDPANDEDTVVCKMDDVQAVYITAAYVDIAYQ